MVQSKELEIRSALIMGHPGHELRVYKFMELYKPRVYILTDGSGHNGSSRVYNTRRIISDTGSTPSEFMGVFTDVELYELILSNEFTKIKDLMDQLSEDLINHQIDLVFGDAIEGFNPTHDLCRYLINAIVGIIENKLRRKVNNFDFLLDGAPEGSPNDPEDGSVTMDLNPDEMERKISASRKYTEIEKDVTRLINRHGVSSFRRETLRQVQNLHELKGWTSDQPFYEIHGRDRVRSGSYEQIITYQGHMKPLGEKLISFTTKFR
ncbi:MAG: hypothetical protein IPL46_00885 [Saprospiraceae bacterium]|nr:hypothetical protein [Saprospiraceae bacterium]